MLATMSTFEQLVASTMASLRAKAGGINTTALNSGQTMLTAPEYDVPNLPRAQALKDGGRVPNGAHGGSIATHLHKSTWSSCPLRQRKPR
jgi:hypothetical protein